MKQTSQKIAVILTVIAMFIFAEQNFSQIRELTDSSKYSNYVGNLRNGINSDNVGLKVNAIQFTGIYQIVENEPLLVEKYKQENDPNIQNLIAISLFMLGDSESLSKIGLDKKSILNDTSLSILMEMYKIKSENRIRNFVTIDKQ